VIGELDRAGLWAALRGNWVLFTIGFVIDLVAAVNAARGACASRPSATAGVRVHPGTAPAGYTKQPEIQDRTPGVARSSRCE